MQLIPKSVTLLQNMPGIEAGSEIPFTYDHHDGSYWARVGTPLVNVPYSAEECEAFPELFKVNYVQEKPAALQQTCLCTFPPQKRATAQQILDKRLAEISASAIEKTEKIHRWGSNNAVTNPAPYSSRL